MTEDSPHDQSKSPPRSSRDLERSVLNETYQAAPGAISTRDLLEPIVMKTVYVSLFAPLLFAWLGSSNLLAGFVGQAKWVVNGFEPVWPTLPVQFELVLDIKGSGHAASYGFLCAALWVWPLTCVIAFFSAHARQRKQILPVSPKEIGQFIILLPCAVVLLFFDQTKNEDPLFGFYPDQWGFFYLRQWFVFTVTALVSAILIYVIGRNIRSLKRR